MHFNPRQTLDYLKHDLDRTELSYETKRDIVKQYLDVSIHLIYVSFSHVECGRQSVFVMVQRIQYFYGHTDLLCT